MVLIIFNLLVWTAVAILCITQVLIPWIKGTELFPWFRKNELADQVEDLRSEVSHLKDVNALTALRDKLLNEKETLSKKD